MTLGDSKGTVARLVTGDSPPFRGLALSPVTMALEIEKLVGLCVEHVTRHQRSQWKRNPAGYEEPAQ